MRLSIITLGLLCICVTARADSVDAHFARALANLDSQRPDQAAVELQRLVALGIDDPDVYANLGIAHAESFRYGRAMVAFERGLSLRPSDAVAQAGLESAESILARRRAELAGAQTAVVGASPLRSLGRVVPEPIESAGVIASSWLLGLCLAGLAYARRESLRIALGTTALIALVCVGVFGTALVGRARPASVLARGIVVAASAPARSAPDERAPQITSLSEGERVDVVERHGRYVRVATGERTRGWIERRAIGTY